MNGMEIETDRLGIGMGILMDFGIDHFNEYLKEHTLETDTERT